MPTNFVDLALRVGIVLFARTRRVSAQIGFGDDRYLVASHVRRVEGFFSLSRRLNGTGMVSSGSDAFPHSMPCS
jgi:hypothetical protein